MPSDSKKGISRKHFLVSVIVAFCTALICFTWYLKTIYSDSLEFQPFTLEYFVLVPRDIAVTKLSTFGSVASYHFSAADGPKPEIILVKILLKGDVSQRLNTLAAFFIKEGYAGPYEKMQKSNNEISIVRGDACSIDCEVVISLMTYL
jgi:hypothetical protein